MFGGGGNPLSEQLLTNNPFSKPMSMFGPPPTLIPDPFKLTMPIKHVVMQNGGSDDTTTVWALLSEKDRKKFACIRRAIGFFEYEDLCAIPVEQIMQIHSGEHPQNKMLLAIFWARVLPKIAADASADAQPMPIMREFEFTKPTMVEGE